MRYYITISICSIFLASQLQAADIVSKKSGSWNDGSTWNPNGVPSATDNVTIRGGHTITFNAASACNNLTVGDGVTVATLAFNNNASHIFSVNNITVNVLSVFNVVSGAAIHTLNLSGDLLNNGSFDMRFNTNAYCNTWFLKNGSQLVSGNGTQTEFAGMVLNLGGSGANVLEITSTAFTNAHPTFLTLLSGTLKLSTPAVFNLTPLSDPATIPAAAGIWMNAPNGIFKTVAACNLYGSMRVSAGELSIGNNANCNLVSVGGTLVVSGGTLSVAGNYDASTSPGTFSITGGLMRLPTVNTQHQLVAPFNASAAGSRFHMSGGRIIIIKEGGNGSQDLGYTNINFAEASVSGGTLQIGEGVGAWPPNQMMNINSEAPLPDLELAAITATGMIVRNTTILGNVLFNTGVLASGSYEILAGGNWTGTGLFMPGTGTVTFNGPSTQTVSRVSCENFHEVHFDNNGLKILECNVTASGNFSVGAGAEVQVGLANATVTVLGDFVNDGTFRQGTGMVSMAGTGGQNISGQSITSFYDLDINNTAGVHLGAEARIIGSLYLRNGTFSINGSTLTLVSDSAGTARVAEITGTGDIAGNILVQRYLPGGATGWVHMGTPMSSTLTFADWDDDIYITCPGCPDGYPNFYSVYSYDETASGLMGNPLSYVPVTSVSVPIVPLKGYWVYTGTAQFTTAPVTIDVLGEIRKFNCSIPLNFSNYGNTSEDGWNLISNPYPSSISWTALHDSTPGIDNALYVYNADLNAGAGGYASYVNGVSSPEPGSGGIGDEIPMGQGFFVHSTGDTALLATESVKVPVASAMLRSGQKGNLLRLALRGWNSSGDEAVLYYQENAGTGFDARFDAYKLKGSDPLAPAIALQDGNTLLHIHGVPPVNGSFSMPLKTVTGRPGTYTISAIAKEFARGTCIVLLDRYTSGITDLLAGDYIFELSDTTRQARFELIITHQPLNVDLTVHHPTCKDPAEGWIMAAGQGSGPWNYHWTENGQALRTVLQKGSADTLRGLASGNIRLEVTTAGACDLHQSEHQVIPQMPVYSKFTTVDTVDLSRSGKVQFINQSQNAAENYWDFGLGQGLLSGYSPVFEYALPGSYQVILYGIGATGCSDSASKRIVVVDGATVVGEIFPRRSWNLKNTWNNHYELEMELGNPQPWSARLFDQQGRMIMNYGESHSDQLRLNIDLNGQPAGIYFLNISSSESHAIKLMAR